MTTDVSRVSERGTNFVDRARLRGPHRIQNQILSPIAIFAILAPGPRLHRVMGHVWSDTAQSTDHSHGLMAARPTSATYA